MKKHAKKSLWIPILALVSVIAIAASCYLAQTFNAFAEEEVDAAAVEAPVPNPSLGTMATIHLSTGDMFSGRVGNSPGDLGEPYFAWSGEKDMYYPSDVEDFRIYTPIRSELDGQQMSHGEVIIVPVPAHVHADRADGNIRVCSIDLSYTFYEYVGATVNYRVADNTWDITINVTPKYYIGFNANGGKFEDGDSIKWIAQGEFNDIKLPSLSDGPVWRESGEKFFAGWYTDPFWGTRVEENTQAPGWGEITMLYAHWVDQDEPITLSYTAGGLGQMFKYELYEWYSSTLIESGTTWNYTVDSDILPPNPFYFYGTELFIDENGQIKLVSCWEDGNGNEYDLFITGASGQRISGISHNGAEVNLLYYLEEGDFDFPYSTHNNFTISTEWAVPSYIAVASDNGELFSYEIRGNGGKKIEFASDYLPIFVDEDEYVFYSYGAYPPHLYPIGFNASEYEQGNGPSLTITVINFAEHKWTTYIFKDNLVSILDWFDLNTHILGVDVDGEAVPMGNHVYKLPVGWHTFGLEMTDEDLNTTVTYNATGGKFADDSDTITLDAEYGKALPVVDNPVAIDNQFIGWFTEPEGGVQVDPANYSWQPWELWYGAKLYAHWALNPQPVPPEPGPTPEPVNPDVPGGGGAQTGDSMPLVPIAALAVIAALGCGLALRKEYF